MSLTPKLHGLTRGPAAPAASGDPDDPPIRLSAPPERIVVARHSGPGLRLIMWVQGCSLNCTRRCLNPHLLRPDGGHVVPASRLTRALLRLADDYREAEGVTVLGGEPFDQADALACALSPLRAAGLSLMVYTGHTLESLRTLPGGGAAGLLGLCDILVDGPFVEELYDEGLVWRGSTNQRLLCISARYSPADIEEAIAQQGRAAAVSGSASGAVAVSGAQSPASARRLRQLTRPPKPLA
jgi:anaerobic ribonucleoside-triphosphate reductase activating protein